MIKCLSYIESLDEINTGFTSEVLNAMDIFLESLVENLQCTGSISFDLI